MMRGNAGIRAVLMSSADAQAQYFDPGSGANQWLVRPGVGYEIREGVKAWAGYARST